MIGAAITKLEVPAKKAGQTLVMDIAYTITGTGATLANPVKIFIVAKDDVGNKKELKGLTLWRDSYSGTDSLNLWPMPSRIIKLEVRIYWHPEIKGWDWAWWK